MDESLIEKQNGNFANTVLGAVLLTNFENMIEIIKEQVKMPSLSTERRFQKICVNNKWEVVDTHNENRTRYKGAYEDVMIACHNLNKKFYRDGVI